MIPTSDRAGRVPPTWWWAYLLVLVPVISDAIETGRLPSHPRDFVTEVVMGLVVAVFVRRIHRDMVQLRAQAETDPLTGLANRRRFLEDLRREVGRSSRSDLPLTVAILDVDGFKKVNDERGHATGDIVLCSVAEWMRGCARREVDGWYRIGGDEFALILAGLSRSEAVTLIGGACRRSGSPPEDADVTVSWGVAELDAGENEDQVIGRADLEMYRAKSGQSTTGGTLWLQIFDSSGRPVDAEMPSQTAGRRWGRLMAAVAIAVAAAMSGVTMGCGGRSVIPASAETVPEGPLSPRDRDRIAELASSARQQLAVARASIEGGEANAGEAFDRSREAVDEIAGLSPTARLRAAVGRARAALDGGGATAGDELLAPVAGELDLLENYVPTRRARQALERARRAIDDGRVAAASRDLGEIADDVIFDQVDLPLAKVRSALDVADQRLGAGRSKDSLAAIDEANEGLEALGVGFSAVPP